MKAFKREIVIFALTALATLLAVAYFFNDMKEGMHVAQTNLFTLTAAQNEAILTVNRPALFARMFLSKPSVYKAFASEVPEIYLSMLQKHTEIAEVQFSFHPQGIVMYAKADKSTAGRIENELQNNFFPSFAPQRLTKGGITFTYYPEAGNRFFGFYQHDGIWVASYSKKLLEEVAYLQRSHKEKLSEEQKQLHKSLDPNAPLNLLIKTAKLDLYVNTSDSTRWRIGHQWLGADLFESEGNICYFSSLPYEKPADSLYQSLADTLSVRIEQCFPPLHTTSQCYEENGKIYFTGCTF